MADVPARFSPVCEMLDRSSARRRITLLSGKMIFQEYTDSMRALDQPSIVNVR